MIYKIRLWSKDNKILETLSMNCNCDMQLDDLRQIARLFYDNCGFVDGVIVDYSIEIEESISNL